MSQHMRFKFLSHLHAAKARMSLHICAVTPEPLLLAYTKNLFRNSSVLKRYTYASILHKKTSSQMKG